MEVPNSSKTSAIFHQLTQRHILENSNSIQPRFENLKFRIIAVFEYAIRLGVPI
jgi:hypothetical protein